MADFSCKVLTPFFSLALQTWVKMSGRWFMNESVISQTSQSNDGSL